MISLRDNIVATVWVQYCAYEDEGGLETLEDIMSNDVNQIN